MLKGNRDPRCLLVIVGVGADGTNQLVTVADGYRESTGSWASGPARPYETGG